jgi:hypothetical protein|eukprot:COSAG01_NODE_2447_length_7683_cov_10.152294_5_plen_62_part_00
MPFNLTTEKPFVDGWTSCMGVPNFTEYFKTVNKGGQLHNKSSYQYRLRASSSVSQSALCIA